MFFTCADFFESQSILSTLGKTGLLSEFQKQIPGLISSSKGLVWEECSYPAFCGLEDSRGLYSQKMLPLHSPGFVYFSFVFMINIGKSYLLPDINVFRFGTVAVLVDASCLWLAMLMACLCKFS